MATMIAKQDFTDARGDAHKKGELFSAPFHARLGLIAAGQAADPPGTAPPTVGKLAPDKPAAPPAEEAVAEAPPAAPKPAQVKPEPAKATTPAAK